jgi:hypothetical protein
MYTSSHINRYRSELRRKARARVRSLTKRAHVKKKKTKIFVSVCAFEHSLLYKSLTNGKESKTRGKAENPQFTHSTVTFISTYESARALEALIAFRSCNRKCNAPSYRMTLEPYPSCKIRGPSIVCSFGPKDAAAFRPALPAR